MAEKEEHTVPSGQRSLGDFGSDTDVGGLSMEGMLRVISRTKDKGLAWSSRGQHLPGTCEALGSSPCTVKKRIKDSRGPGKDRVPVSRR